MNLMTFILAGGSGTRLAPLSLTKPGYLPKQFLALVGEKTMLQEAIDRVPKDSPVVIIPEERYVDTVKAQSSRVEVLAEPFGCNTAAAIGLAARYALNKTKDDQTILFFMPADHIMDKELFQKYFDLGVSTAEETNKIVVIGIKPDRPETGYGYIQVQESLGATHKVVRFVEKPDVQTAKHYLNTGAYFWNAGIFVVKVKVILEALKNDAPVIYQQIMKIDLDGDLSQEITKAYTEIKAAKQNISIDYAVMEKEAENMLLIPADERLEWNDVGGWAALEKYYPKQKDNLILNYLNVHIKTKHKDLLIVTTVNGLLICPLLLAQRAREIITGIETGKSTELINSPGTTIENTSNLYVGVIGLNNYKVFFDGKTLKL